MVLQRLRAEFGCHGARRPAGREHLDYWGVPMHRSYGGSNEWPLQSGGVVGIVVSMHGPLRGSGYDRTSIIDPAVNVYSEDAAGVDVIWSRRGADETEIERIAAHFEVRLEDKGWRVISATGTPTTADTIGGSWVRSSPDA
ncbi:hypothetical protein [Streptomyces sp. NPDC019937]|uniref:DUF6841 family protein n=1 Tax=Streptomyces sp. NPDC019937 TaxID=3154787 RepID=UPI0033D8D0B4